MVVLNCCQCKRPISTENVFLNSCQDETNESFWRSEDRASWHIIIIKPTRCTNFSNLFLVWNCTCFGQILCPSSGFFHSTHSNGYMWYRFADSLRAGSGRNIYHILLPCVQWKSPDERQRNCPKHVEFYTKNKPEKLVHLVGFIIRNYHDARSPERQLHGEYHKNINPTVR